MMRDVFMRYALLLCMALAGPLAPLATGHAATLRESRQYWPDFEIIIWQGQTPERLDGLHRLGVTAGKIFGQREEFSAAALRRSAGPFRKAGMRWYVENIATDFYAPYHRWRPDRPVTWLFDEAKRRHFEKPDDISVFFRDPSLVDQAWIARIRARLTRHAAAQRALRPLFYSLGDEVGIGDLAAAWDFDFSPQSLAAMRVWLRARYGSLQALNRQWGSSFADWNAVRPMTTDEALARSDGNFSAWADFKAWMDHSFAQALRAGTQAVHTGDPAALSGIEGSQTPGWGGYDYGLISNAVDVLEIYEFANNLDMARSFSPGTIQLVTSPKGGQEEIRRLWHSVILGARGLILWDDGGELVNDDGSPAPRGKELAGLFGMLRGPVGRELLASTPHEDGVAILWSQASLRTRWLLDRQADGKPWARRDPETEYDEDNAHRAATRCMAGHLTHLGVQPRWITADMLASGALAQGIKVLFLPHALALSPGEAEQIRRFIARGGVAVADIPPGQYDAHSRRLPAPLLASQQLRRIDPRDCAAPAGQQQIADALRAGHAMPGFSVTDPAGTPVTDLDIRVLRHGKEAILALQQPAGQTASRSLVVHLSGPAQARDLFGQLTLPRTDRVTVTLDPYLPVLLALPPGSLAPSR